MPSDAYRTGFRPAFIAASLPSWGILSRASTNT